MTGMSTLGKMSVGVRRITTGLRRRINKATTTKVYGRLRATLTIHIPDRMRVGAGGIHRFRVCLRQVCLMTSQKSARERILETADDLFYHEGIHAVGIDTIIEKSGVAKMSLYRSFASKDELVAAYLEARGQRYWQWWDGVMALNP